MILIQRQSLRAVAGLLASFATLACASAEEVEIEKLRKEIKELRIKVRGLEKHNESLQELLQQIDKHFDTGTKISKPPEKPKREIEIITIRFNSKGDFKIDGKPAQTDAIRTKIESIVGEDKDPRVALDVDARCPYRAVLEVINALSGLGIRHVNFVELRDPESDES